MGKNKNGRTHRLKIFVDYKVKGYNQNKLINILEKRGVELYNVKKTAADTMTLSVSFFKCEKFFAITKELCYNVEKQRERGRDYPLLWLARNVGIVTGTLLFVIIAYLSNDFLFSVNYSGSGSIYSQEVSMYLNEQGIKPLSRFSHIDLRRLSNNILANNDHLSFVSCHKSGNRLMVEMALSKEEPPTESPLDKQLVSLYDGQIIKVRVYRGECKFNVGDSVKKGDIIVDGEILSDGSKDDVLAEVLLKVTDKYQYISHRKGEEELAIIFATESMNEREITGANVITTKVNGQYHYTVSVDYIVMADKPS